MTPPVHTRIVLPVLMALLSIGGNAWAQTRSNVFNDPFLQVSGELAASGPNPLRASDQRHGEPEAR